MPDLTIKPQHAVFDERILDRWGNEFRFDHAKGLAEWIKNAIDAYIRQDLPDAEQFVFLRFVVNKGKTPRVLQCIDFVGMTHEDIEKAFKRWGDPDAAKRGKRGVRVFGGHGNGGKFYMRQMFTTSRFITWRDGKLNVFGFNEKKKYGFAKGYEDCPMKLRDALRFAELDTLSLPEPLKKRLQTGNAGFTVVIGENPKKAARKNSVRSIVERLRVHPQARRLLQFKPIYVILNDETEGFRLAPDPIRPKPSFEGPYEFKIPDMLRLGPEEIPMSKPGFEGGKLMLSTSEEPFNRLGDRAALNSIDILGRVGAIASYQMNELGFIRNAAESEFIYGECFCPILEDPEDDSVRNDREKLIDNDRTKALLIWIAEKVNELADKMAEQTQAQREEQELKQSSQFNELLNRWKNRFMTKLYAEIFSGAGSGDGFGGSGGGGAGGDGKSEGGDKRGGGVKETEQDSGGGNGPEKKKAPRFPIVLLSNHDPDPLHPETGQSVICEMRQPPIYQRFEDVQAGIYWINTQAPFARQIIGNYGTDDARWRDYMFHRYIDIITKQTIHDTGKRQTEFTASDVDRILEDISTRIYAAAANELNDFLFKAQYNDAPIIQPDIELSTE